MSTETEQRRFPRHALQLPLYITVGGGVVRKTVSLESRDVSAGGVAFETSQKIPLAAEAKLILSKLGDLPDGALILGRVARLSPPDRATGRILVGVEFTEFVMVTREELLERISRWKQSTTPTPAAP
ncbi:MAG TPA: PilZ domain-containing protein [Vicinamibacteria bacterium]